jgi:hypothetical protein
MVKITVYIRPEVLCRFVVIMRRSRSIHRHLDPIAQMASAARIRHKARHVGGNRVALVREIISPQR